MARRIACLAMLDRQLEQLEMDRALMKRELVVKVDCEFDRLRDLTLKIKEEIEASTRSLSPPTPSDASSGDDIEESTDTVQVANTNKDTALTLPSTSNNSTGRKRKFTRKNDKPVVVRKRSRNRNWICIYPGCGKAFSDDGHLVDHERTHTGVRPFTCTWRDCHFDAAQRSQMVKHIRTVHLKLPLNKKDQLALNITDRRDPNRWIRVNQQLVERRLTEADFGVTIASKNKKTDINSVNKTFACKSPGCGFTCDTDFNLAAHERAIHLRIRPFHCTWTGCDFTAAQFSHVITHVRTKHFGLPATVKLQRQLNIEDDRDPNQYVRVVQELADRRL